MGNYNVQEKVSGQKKSSNNQEVDAVQLKQNNMADIIQRAKINPNIMTQDDAMVLQKIMGNRAISQVTNGVGDKQNQIIQGKFEIVQKVSEEKNVNNTGLPDDLKVGMENLSGLAMDDVKVYYNSLKPAQVGAFAYTDGTEIYVSPGQEQHLAHEAWHVVQQKQDRVQPTMQMKGGLLVNDDKALEREADAMGIEAMRNINTICTVQRKSIHSNNSTHPVQFFDWWHSTPIQTILDLVRNPSWEGTKDLIDLRRARLNPLNMIEGIRNYREQNAGGNYHTGQRHGAHNTVTNAMGRLNQPSTMQDRYIGGVVPNSNTQGRFNSEAWESFSWRKAKGFFEAGVQQPVTWIPGPFPNGMPRSTWSVLLDHGGRDVGISQRQGQAINSVSMVKVAINYHIIGGNLQAYNGQMFPTNAQAAAAGQVQPGDPIVQQNGAIIQVPYKLLGYFGI